MATATSDKPANTGKRKPAPQAEVGRVWTNERDEIVAHYAPDCIGKDSKFTPYFADPQESPQRRKRMGYEPVIDEETREQVTHNGDPLWKTLRTNSTALIDRPAQQSKETVEARWTGQDSDSQGLGATPTDEASAVRG